MQYSKSIAGKTALVLGGAGAIGSETARRLSALGARVAITYRPRENSDIKARAVVAGLQGEGHAAFPADVTDTQALLAVREAIQAQFGRLDILVNAAGYTTPVVHNDLEALTDAIIDEIFKVNWRGQFAAIRTFAPMLKSSGDGVVVSISSISAFTGIGSSIAYCAAKAGIDVMTKSLARVLAPEVRVLAVSPGVVDSSFVPGRTADFNERAAKSTPLGRIGTAADAASAVMACVTMLGFSTGHIIQVDGGRAL